MLVPATLEVFILVEKAKKTVEKFWAPFESRESRNPVPAI